MPDDDHSANETQVAASRLRLLDALVIGIERRAELLDIIDGADSAAVVREVLMTKFGVDEAGATAMLDLQVRRFARLERDRIFEEREHLRARLGQ